MTLSCFVGSSPTDYTIVFNTGTERHSMKRVFWIVCVIASVWFLAWNNNAYAQWSFDNSGGRVFDMSKNITKKTTVELKYVEPQDIQKTCDSLSRKFGNNGYKYGVLACTFFWDDKCVVVVPKKVDMRTVGHEMMHCFQGDWHAGKNE